MANEIDELIIKAKVEVDSSKLKAVKKDLEEVREKFKSNAIKLGFNEQQISGKLASVGAEAKTATDVIKTLKEGNKLFEGVLKNTKNTAIVSTDLLKLDTKEADRKKRDKLKSKEELPDFVKNLASLNAKGAATEGASALGGAMFGAAGGAATGLIVGAIIEAIKSIFDLSAKLVDDKLVKDVKLEQFSLVVGKSKTELYKLNEMYKAAGGSLESVVAGTQSFVDELLGGISPEKAQMFSMLGINLKEEFMKSGGDAGKLRDRLYESIKEATKTLPQTLQSGYLRQAGYSTEEQVSRLYKDRKETRQLGANALKTAGHISTGEESFQQRLQFRGKESQIEAMKYKAAGTPEAMKAALAALEMQAKIIKITTGLVQIFGKTIETYDKAQTAGRASSVGKYLQNFEDNVGKMRKEFNNPQSQTDNVGKMRKEFNNPQSQTKVPVSSNAAISGTQNKG